jgi:hypothetical protein
MAHSTEKKPMSNALKNKSIHFGIPLQELANSLKPGQSLSGRLNTMAERYADIVKQHGIELTEAETQVLGDCCSGTWMEPLLIRHLADEVRASDHAWTEAAESLAKKLDAASFADVIATIEKNGF